MVRVAVVVGSGVAVVGSCCCCRAVAFAVAVVAVFENALPCEIAVQVLVTKTTIGWATVVAEVPVTKLMMDC